MKLPKTSQNFPKNDPSTPQRALTLKQERAALLIFEGERSRDEIAKEVGVDRRTLYTWEHENTDFQKRLLKLFADLENEMGVSTVAQKIHRLRLLDDRYRRNTALIEKRAKRFADSADPDCGDELATGMYKKRVSRRYANGQMISEEIEALFDVALYRALHDDHMLAMKEMGELVTRAEVSGPGGKPIQIQTEVRVVGYALGGIDDALDWLLQLRDAGRLPTNEQECNELITEIEAREDAKRAGKPVPPLTEPYIPALDALLEQQ